MEGLINLAIEKFGNENIINTSQGIFFLTLRDYGGRHYEGRKVLDNLKLSQEEYEIDEEVCNTNELGQVAHSEYRVRLKGT